MILKPISARFLETSEKIKGVGFHVAKNRKNEVLREKSPPAVGSSPTGGAFTEPTNSDTFYFLLQKNGEHSAIRSKELVLLIRKLNSRVG